jgi:hypothetical protein
VADFAGPLIGGGITAGVSLISFAYGFGRLSRSVEFLTKSVDLLRQEIDKQRDDLITIHERLARLERSTPSY